MLSQLKPCTCLRLLASQCKEGPEDSSSVTCMLREKRSCICELGFLSFSCFILPSRGYLVHRVPRVILLKCMPAHACTIFCIHTHTLAAGKCRKCCYVRSLSFLFVAVVAFYDGHLLTCCVFESFSFSTRLQAEHLVPSCKRSRRAESSKFLI